MKIAIAGAGMTGAYLYRLLRNRGEAVELFDRPPLLRCGLTPCAWGTCGEFVHLVREAGLDAERYVLKRLDHLWMDEVKIRAELLTFDKPRLVRDLLAGAEPRREAFRPEEFERVIDATGVARALLPPAGDDVVLDCCQYLVETGESLVNRIQLGGIGYAWCFPLGHRRYHLGCGSLFHDPRQRLRRLGWLEDSSGRWPRTVICGCSGRIRLTGPRQAQPFVAAGGGGEIWGIGEAIGCVAPLAGDGIVPGMRSVELLLGAWDDADRYRQTVLEEFAWMEAERGVLDTLRKGRALGLRQARVLHRNSRRMGMQVGMREALGLLKNLR